MKKERFIITCAFGLEKILKNELKRLNYPITSAKNGAITIMAPLSAVAELNLNLRTAERVYLQLAEFKAESFDQLFAGVEAIEWQDYLAVDMAFPVNAKSNKSKLFSLSDIQSISKKAIVQKLQKHYRQSWFKESASQFEIEVRIDKDIVSVVANSSGDSLHKRGYRARATAAPLKETTAAALVLLSDWYGDQPLVDPMCGSGTILIEAALLKRNIAVGLSRKFAFEKWAFIDPDYLKEARKKAYAAIDYDKELALYGSDIDDRAIAIAKENAELAGVDDCIEFKTLDVLNWQPKQKEIKIISNVPYGERLSDKKSVLTLYQKLGKIIEEHPEYACFILTSNDDFERAFGRKADRNRKLYNGKIRCYYYQYYAN